MKRFLLLFALLCATFQLSAQYAPADSSSARELNARAARKILRTGRICFIAGGIETLLGGTLMIVPTLLHQNRVPAEPGMVQEDMLSPIVYCSGLALTLSGVATTLFGIPVTVAGKGIRDADTYWQDLRYDDPGQRGFGVILDLAGFIPWAETRATAGYHFNQHLFLGGGVGAAVNFANWNNNVVPGDFEVPVYADFRYSIVNGFYAPFIGVSGGYEILSRSPVLGGDLGLRIRQSTSKPKSFWVALTGEMGGAFGARAGVRFSWSF